jgi:hypothetical protein
LHDLAVVAERRTEATVSLQEMKRRLKNDDILSCYSLCSAPPRCLS